MAKQVKSEVVSRKPLSELKHGDVIATVEPEVVAELMRCVNAYRDALRAMEEAAVAARQAREGRELWWQRQSKLHDIPTPAASALFGLMPMVAVSEGQEHPVGTVYMISIGADEQA